MGLSGPEFFAILIGNSSNREHTQRPATPDVLYGLLQPKRLPAIYFSSTFFKDSKLKMGCGTGFNQTISH